MSDDGMQRWIGDLSSVLLAETIEELAAVDDPILIDEYRRLTADEGMREFLEALIAVSSAVGVRQGYELGVRSA